MFRFLRRWIHRSNEDSMRQEMEHHLELLTEQHVGRGVPEREARYAALRDFGGVEQIKERCRDARAGVWLAQLWQDLQYGCRSLRKHPGFTFAAVLTLAVGMGANATVVSIVNDLLFRPAGAPAGELAVLQTRQTGSERKFRPFSYDEFRTCAAAAHVFSDLAAMQFGTALFERADAPEARLVCFVSERYFPILGVSPAVGRFFSAEECLPNADARVLVASHALWRRLGSREDFVGTRLRFDGIDYTVIGVAPAGFGGLQWALGPEAWLPLGVMSNFAGVWGWGGPTGKLTDPRTQRLQLFGTLRGRLTLDSAAPLTRSIDDALNAAAGATGEDRRELVLTSPSRTNLDQTGLSDESFLGLYAAAAVGMTLLVLLVACVNVANMLFSRGVARQQEIAVRLCLGASRARIVRQLLVEGLLLAGAGTVAGLLLFHWAHQYLRASAGQVAGPFVMHVETAYDWRLLGATFLLCVLTTIVVALAPALRTTRRDLVTDLKSPAGGSATGLWERFFSGRHCLVMVQIALALMLVASAGVLVRSVLQADQDRGFSTDRQLVVQIDHGLARTPAESVAVKQNELLQRAARISGVRRAAVASAVPFSFSAQWRSAYAVSRPEQRGFASIVTSVSHGYFEALGIPLLRGRDFTAVEAQEGGGGRVAIIDDSLGRTLFGESDPIGQFVSLGRRPDDPKARPAEIVGIIRSPREDALQPSEPAKRVYLPFGQERTASTYLHLEMQPGVALGDASAVVRRELQAVDPATPLLVCEPLSMFIGRNMNVWLVRFLATLFCIFGLISVLLAVIGAYGVKAYVVARRTREVGVRMALGATRQDVLGLFLRESMAHTGVALATGLILAGLSGVALSKLLYGVSPVEGRVLALAVLLLAFSAAIATLVPAWRATRVSPMLALRTE